MSDEPIATKPSSNSRLGFASLLANAGALVQAVWKQPGINVDGLPRGDGRVVLVIPAFLAGDAMTAGLRRFLTSLGYQTATANVRLNLGATSALIAKLESALLGLNRVQGGPILIVGQSLGGLLARDLGLRFPERIRRIVTLCSPLGIPITTPLAPGIPLIAPLFDAAWLERRKAIVGPLSVPVTALYSEDDGVVDWRECLQEDHPNAENVRVRGAHSTIGSNPRALAEVARALST